MTDAPKDPFRYGPSRGELKVWLAIALAGSAIVLAVVISQGMPSGPALIEIVVLPAVLFGYLGGRSVKRLIRREHP
jgi:hypothetical protein